MDRRAFLAGGLALLAAPLAAEAQPDGAAAQFRVAVAAADVVWARAHARFGAADDLAARAESPAVECPT